MQALTLPESLLFEQFSLFSPVANSVFTWGEYDSECFTDSICRSRALEDELLQDPLWKYWEVIRF